MILQLARVMSLLKWNRNILAFKFVIIQVVLFVVLERNINNLRYTDYTTLIAESEEELKSLSMKVKEESEKIGLIGFRKLRSWHLVPSLHGR